MLPVHLYVLGGICTWYGNAQGPPYVWTSPCVWMPPHVSHTPLHLYAYLYVYILWCICMWYGGYTPYVEGLGVSAHLSGFWCLSGHLLDVHYASSCTFLVVHYVSSLYYQGYNYYSSGDYGVFWYVMSIIGDHGFLFDGASCNIGSAWCGSATTLTPRCSGGVLGLALCHSSNLHLQYLFRLMLIMPWVLNR